MRRPNKSLANLVFSEAGLSHAFDGKPGQDSSRLFLLFMFVYRIDVCISIQRCLQRFSFCGNCVKPSDKPGREAYEMRKRKVFSPPSLVFGTELTFSISFYCYVGSQSMKY